MKTITKLTTLVLLSALSFGNIVKAEELILPVIKKPAILEEGTQRELTPAQVAELLPWAKDSKIFLADLLDVVSGLSTTDKIERLVDGIKQVVGESAPKNSELLMRYVLNRGLVISEILSRETDANTAGASDAKVRVLKTSVLMAIKYYDTDMAILAGKTTAPFVVFGIDYFDFLTELNKSVFDASAQYAIQRTALEWLQWDLYRDLNNAKYAPQVVKINNSLKIFPDKRLSDAQSISLIRQMKAIIVQLKNSDAFLKIEEMKPEVVQRKKEEAEAKAKVEAERLKKKEEERRKKEEEEEKIRRSKHNYQYFSYDQTPGSISEGCYEIASNGVVMWGQGKVTNSFCESDVYQYFSYDQTPGSISEGCYQKSNNNITMWAKGPQHNSHCSNNSFRYFSYNQTPGSISEGCYEIASNGVTMWKQGRVNNSNCTR